MLNFFSTVLLLCLLSAIPLSALAQGNVDVSVESLYNDNISRSIQTIDIHSDLNLKLAANAGYYWQVADYTGISLLGSFTNTVYQSYSGLNNIEAGLGLLIKHKFGIGEMAPALSFELGFRRNQFNLNNRDAWVYSTGVVFNKRLSQRLSGNAGLRFEQRDGDHNVPKFNPANPTAKLKPGNSWDVQTRSVFVSGEWEISESMWLNSSFQLQDGEVVCTATPFPQMLNDATAVTFDTLFGAQTVAYRIPALTKIVTLDLNRALLAAGTGYFGFEYQDSRGNGNIDYDVLNIRAGFIYSF